MALGPGSADATQQQAVLVEAGTATVIAVTTHNPFGEAERATGRWLPWLTAAVTGGGLAWAGPLAYLVLAEVALMQDWTSPWTWPARPPHDRGAAICAGLVFAAGIVITVVRGARTTLSD